MHFRGVVRITATSSLRPCGRSTANFMRRFQRMPSPCNALTHSDDWFTKQRPALRHVSASPIAMVGSNQNRHRSSNTLYNRHVPCSGCHIKRRLCPSYLHAGNGAECLPLVFCCCRCVSHFVTQRPHNCCTFIDSLVTAPATIIIATQ